MDIANRIEMNIANRILLYRNISNQWWSKVKNSVIVQLCATKYKPTNNGGQTRMALSIGR